MKLVMLSVYDSKVQLFETPHFARSKGEALRDWADACNDLKTKMGKYPSDFTLFHLGEYDEASGKTEMLPTPVSLGLALEFKKIPENTLPMFPDKKDTK